MKSPLVKTLKAAHFMAGKAGTEAEIKRHRKLADWAGRLATPKGDVERRRFRLGRIRCEEFKPLFAHNPGYVILYCHGGGYVSGGLGYAGNLSVKLALATGFTVYSFAYRLAPEHPYPAAVEDVNTVRFGGRQHGVVPHAAAACGRKAGAAGTFAVQPVGRYDRDGGVL